MCDSKILAFGLQLTGDANNMNKPDTIVGPFSSLWPISPIAMIKKTSKNQNKKNPTPH